jgi:hypothetical protein
MDELKDTGSIEPAAEVEAIIQKESEDALRRFRSDDFAARLKARLDTPATRRRFFLLRKPVFVAALGILVLAAAALILGRGPGRRNDRVEAGFRSMTETLAKSDFFHAGGPWYSFGGTYEAGQGRDILAFAAVLIRSSASSVGGAESRSAAPGEEGAPPRPLFSPDERFKILFGDKVILRVLMNIASHKEVRNVA